MGRKIDKVLGAGLLVLVCITLTILVLANFGLVTANIDQTQWLVMSFGTLGLSIYLLEKSKSLNS